MNREGKFQPEQPKKSSAIKKELAAIGASLLAACAEVKPGLKGDEFKPNEQGIPAKKENVREILPEGSFGMDKFGKPYGWDMRGYKYFTEEPEFSDLVEFDSHSSKGVEIKVKLRKEAYDAFSALALEYEEAAEENRSLPNHHLELTSGFRTFEEQEKLRKIYEKVPGAAFAESPGCSEHHLGTGMDFRNAKQEEMYNWLMEFNKIAKNLNHIPRLIKHGFVPTVSSEPWHFRYVGIDQALQFWMEYGNTILDNHLLYLKKKENKVKKMGKKKKK